MRRFLLLPLALLLAGSLAFAACGDDDDADGENAMTPIATTNPTAALGGMLAALSILDSTGLHDIDETLNATPPGAIDAQWLGRVQHAQIAVATATWPVELQSDAEALAATLGELAAKLDDDDGAGASPLATRAHDEGHGFSGAGWGALAEAAGVETGAGHDEASGSATPAASGSATPAAPGSATRGAGQRHASGAGQRHSGRRIRR